MHRVEYEECTLRWEANTCHAGQHPQHCFCYLKVNTQPNSDTSCSPLSSASSLLAMARQLWACLYTDADEKSAGVRAKQLGTAGVGDVHRGLRYQGWSGHTEVMAAGLWVFPVCWTHSVKRRERD
ncbi:hypothetical protein AOLI_G00061760 [Acnodon oligacanthus]